MLFPASPSQSRTQAPRKIRDLHLTKSDHATQNPRPTVDTIPRVLLTENSSARLSTPSTTLTEGFPRLQSSLVCQPPSHNRTPPAPSAAASTPPERASEKIASKHCRCFNAPNACTASRAGQARTRLIRSGSYSRASQRSTSATRSRKRNGLRQPFHRDIPAHTMIPKNFQTDPS